MNIYITLDYELFFGSKSGSVDNCLIKPTQKLLELVDTYGIKLIFFVDVGYLIKLQEQKNNFKELAEDYSKITSQIQNFVKNGHTAELHIHPHWENSFYNGKKWVFDTKQYRLSDFTYEETQKIVSKYTNALKKVSGTNPIAYRAGGWSIQPFTEIKNALKKNKIKIDSTVFPQGYYNSNYQYYDFRNVKPFRSSYQFNEDPTLEEPQGEFLEFPISSYKLHPFFYWKFIVYKLFKNKENLAWGDGIAIPKTKRDVLRLITKTTYSVVSIDGLKASFLNKAFQLYQKKTNNLGNFVIIGHPKAFTPYSIKKLSTFLKNVKDDNDFKVFK